MNLSWHIAKKDIRRFWAPLVALCAITALRLIVGTCLIRGDGSDPDYFSRMGVYANIMWGVGLFLTYMLVGAVVHEDSVAGEAFWQTRPISGCSLLAGKSLGLFLMFGLLPVALLVPWWLGCGFGWSEVLRALFETLAIQLAVVLLALPWSVVTRDDGRFLLWTVVVAVAFATAFLVLTSKSKIVRSDFMPQFDMAWFLKIVVLTSLGSLGVAIYQYVTRRTVKSVILIVVVIVLIVSGGRWGRRSGARLGLPRFGGPNGAAKDVTVSFEDPREESTADGFGYGQFNLVAKHVPSDCVLLPLYSEQRLRWADGSITDEQARFEPWGSLYSRIFAGHLLRLVPEPTDEDWMYYAMRHALLPRKTWNPGGADKYFNYFTMMFSPETMIRLFGEKPEYDGTVWFRLMQPEIVAEREVRVGSEFIAGSTESRLVSVENDPEKQDLWLSFIERSPESVWTEVLSATHQTAWRVQPAYIVVTKTRTTASEGINASRVSALIGGVSIVLRKDGFRSRNRWDSSKHIWEKKRGEFDGATLADVNYRETERFSSPVRGEFPRRPPVNDSGASIQNGKYSVSGEVSRAGNYDVGPKENLIIALRTAYGVSDRADLRRVELKRISPDGSTSSTIVDVQAWLESDSPAIAIKTIPILEPGDSIYVPPMESRHSP